MPDATDSSNGQADKRVTIFGGSGFIGRSIVRRLIDAGASVRIGARHPELAKDHLPRAVADKIESVSVDVQDEAGVAAAVREADAVINLVAILYESGPQTFQSLHIDGARRVAAAAKQAGARKGDILVAVDGASDAASESMVLARLLREKRKGERVSLTVLREGRRLDVAIPMQ